MIVARPTMQFSMNGRVGNLESCPFLVVADFDLNDIGTMNKPQIVLDPPDCAQEFSLTPWLIERGVQVLLVAQCDWEAPLYLGRAGIHVIEGGQGAVQAALREYRQFCMSHTVVIPADALVN